VEWIEMELWFLMAVFVALNWGSAGIFAKATTSRLGVQRVAVIIAVVEGTMYTAAFLVFRTPGPISLEDGVLAASSCVIGICGYLCYFESMMEGQVSIVGTISAAYPVLTVVGALLLLSETMTALQMGGVVAIIGGVLALSYERNPGSVTSVSRRSIFFALMAFLLWGVWSLTSKMAVDEIGAGNLFGFYILSSLTAPLLYAWFRRVRPCPMRGTDPSRKMWVLGAMGLCLNVIGAFAYTYALEEGNASLVVPASSAYPIVTVVLAVAILKEKLDRTHALALACVVAGLVMMGIAT
jgi:drug/metabolite transporter (DMT)-like permease